MACGRQHWIINFIRTDIAALWLCLSARHSGRDWAWEFGYSLCLMFTFVFKPRNLVVRLPPRTGHSRRSSNEWEASHSIEAAGDVVILTQVMGRRQWSPSSYWKITPTVSLWTGLPPSQESCLGLTASSAAACRKSLLPTTINQEKKSKQGKSSKRNGNNPHSLRNKPQTRLLSPQLWSLESQALVEGNEREIECYLMQQTFKK